MRRVAGILLVSCLALVLPACGSGGGAKTDETKRAAGLVPKDALAYVSANIEPSDAQKSHVASILEKFPKVQRKTFDSERDQLLGMAVSKLGLNYETDVKPWLGSELALAVLPDTPAPDPVALIKSNDDAKAKPALDKAVARPDADATYRLVKGFAVVVQKKHANLLDVISRQADDSASSLSEQDKFKRVVDQLHDDRLLVAWADGHALVELGKAAIARTGGRARINVSALPSLGMAALDVHAEDNALALGGLVETPGSSGGGDTKLTDALPENSLGAITAWNIGGGLDELLRGVLGANPQVTNTFQRLQQQIGLDVRQDVLSWMHGETVIVAGPPTTGTIPDFALVVSPTDKAKAEAAVTKIATLLERRLGVKLDQRPAPGGGTEYVFPAAIRQGIQPAMALLSDKFILASSPEYLGVLAKGGGGFDSGNAFKNTLDSAKSGTQFQMVLQLSSIRSYIETLLTGQSKTRYDRDLKPWVDHLDAAALRVRKDGGLTKFEAKATVK